MQINISDTMIKRFLVKLDIDRSNMNPQERREALRQNVARLQDHDKLRFLRCNNNMTQKEFGLIIGAAYSTVSHFEDGSYKLSDRAIHYIKESFGETVEP